MLLLLLLLVGRGAEGLRSGGGGAVILVPNSFVEQMWGLEGAWGGAQAACCGLLLAVLLVLVRGRR